jgi:hypothetical protein
VRMRARRREVLLAGVHPHPSAIVERRVNTP